MKTISERGHGGHGGDPPISGKGWGGTLPPDRFQRAGETINVLLSECEECMGGGMLEAASGLAAAAALMARRHGREDLAEAAALRFVVLNIHMGREEEVGRAMDLGWMESEDVRYVIGLFEESAAEEPYREPARTGARKTIAEMKDEILGLIDEFKARCGGL